MDLPELGGIGIVTEVWNPSPAARHSAIQRAAWVIGSGVLPSASNRDRSCRASHTARALPRSMISATSADHEVVSGLSASSATIVARSVSSHGCIRGRVAGARWITATPPANTRTS